jgi:hypothetical protein
VLTRDTQNIAADSYLVLGHEHGDTEAERVYRARDERACVTRRVISWSWWCRRSGSWLAWPVVRCADARCDVRERGSQCDSTNERQWTMMNYQHGVISVLKSTLIPALAE